MAALTPRAIAVLSATLALACGGAGILDPFASGDGSDGQGGTGGSAASTTADADTSDAESGDSGSTGSAGVGWDGELRLVYVRCARTRESVTIALEIDKDGQLEQAERTLRYADIYDRLPTAHRTTGSYVAPCDLVLREADGAQTVLYDCAAESNPDAACAAMDPAVSHDGRKIAFSVSRGRIEHDSMRAGPPLVDPDADGGEQRFFDLPNPELVVDDAKLYVYDLPTGELTALPHTQGELDVSPTFLASGRIAFASTRHDASGTAVHSPGDPWTTRAATERALALHTMALSGRDVELIAPQTLSLDVYPFQLQDGRLAHVSWQAFGMHPYRYDNSAWGSPGARSALLHLYALSPGGSELAALFGQHTHIARSPTHVAVHRMTQTADGTVYVTESGGSAGAGTLYAFSPSDDGVEGPGPNDADGTSEVFRPADLVTPVPWAGTGNFAAPVPEPAVYVPGYADPLLYRGFVRDPEAHPDGGLVLSWAKGGCSDVGARHPEVFGDDNPPFTSGSGSFTSMNVMEYSGLDTPGCDAGIYRVATLPADHPSALEPIVDSVDYHEIMPRLVAPYSAVHGIDAPASPQPLTADIEPGSPFGELAVASMLHRETRSLDGHPFAGLVQWAMQGTDTSDYADDDICGARLLAVQRNEAGGAAGLRASPGHRLLVLGELPVRRAPDVVDARGVPDTSFVARVPADVPLLIQGIDCDGRTLNTSQTPIAVRPGQRVVCTGCHQRSEPGLPFADTAAELDEPRQLGAGTVELLMGGAGTEVETASAPGWGRDYEFERDVFPILQDRCMPCHRSGAPEAGLALDVPGVDAGSTWWTLAADALQTYVDPQRRAPGDPDSNGLKKPQLTKYVRFMSARGSLLYWKTIGARVDGRTDDQFDAASPAGFEDVDFGPAHPTDVTAAEAGVIARWIDTGAGAGEELHRDVTAPTLTALLTDVGQLVLGTTDVGSGVDPESLQVCIVEDGGGCTDIDTPTAAAAGTVALDLPALSTDRELRIRVLDRSGNRSELTRTVAGLGGSAPGDEGSGAGDDGDGGDRPEGSASTGASSAQGGEEGTDQTCGCRRDRAPGLVLLPLMAVLIRRRRGGA